MGVDAASVVGASDGVVAVAGARGSAGSTDAGANTVSTDAGSAVCAGAGSTGAGSTAVASSVVVASMTDAGARGVRRGGLRTLGYHFTCGRGMAKFTNLRSVPPAHGASFLRRFDQCLLNYARTRFLTFFLNFKFKIPFEQTELNYMRPFPRRSATQVGNGPFRPQRIQGPTPRPPQVGEGR